jgi:hypothetical protein
MVVHLCFVPVIERYHIPRTTPLLLLTFVAVFCPVPVLVVVTKSQKPQYRITYDLVTVCAQPACIVQRSGRSCREEIC